MESADIRVRGRVQGVGFRPTVWRLAQELGLSGEVRNDADGVLIRVAGERGAIDCLLNRIQHDPPPLARIDRIERLHGIAPLPAGFSIAASAAGIARTEVAPDAAICPDCAREVLDPSQRRYRYSFTNCTHCGPRFSIVRRIPFDRAATTMASFPLCAACDREYRSPSDRRFHAEAIACPECGPRLREPLDHAVELLQRGGIIAIKGLGGYQLACDATDPAAVARLRAAKHRDTKPFALMARDLDIIRRYCAVDALEAAQLTSPAAPIVLLRTAGEQLPHTVASGLATLGFMLPTTPLHLLLLRDIDRPVVMTSGNRSDEPQIIDDDEAIARLGPIADSVLSHDRPIATRIDDSVVRTMSEVPRVLRRARGFAPAPIALPPGFAAAPDLLAAGGEQKSTICMLKDGAAILSPHIGDLDDARTFDEYRRTIAHHAALFDHTPKSIALDMHPEYLSSKHARETGLELIEVQHHHAHVAACLAENGWALDAPPVLGIVLDGLGWGEDGTIWGGEFLLADYRASRRVGMLKPVAMPGGTAAIREPWRNLYAHFMAAMTWQEFTAEFAMLDVHRALARNPRAMLDSMILNGINTPLASSCGRLFDAMAAAIGICRERQGHEGDAASRLEALTSGRDTEVAPAYPMPVVVAKHATVMVCEGTPSTAFIDTTAMWRSVLADLRDHVPRPLMASRFHNSLARAAVEMTRLLAMRHSFTTVALSGGCFQNAVLFEQTARRLRDAGFTVLTHRLVPPNDGGLSLGQAAVAAAQLLAAA